ncbi:formyltetrahydrofolate deformylase [Sphingomonas changnyeongensis]|uniref:Formyltetrahydrofolate deformylase n=1 Tax=Sphingomonas changnyeongensis TaxID=2698679 RepID=A0A7Z2NVC0_9SPHN|nr:formyltetrahydrofolate deformylase [Sphingomonas changnyeongensis]QHL90483.1 formyltetrahydrofolate deformylase [Sphingomonas changnyeongensis]
MTARLVLTIHCPDRPGIVGAVGGLLHGLDCNIVESAQFGDQQTRRFFMRIVIESPSLGRDGLRGALAPVAGQYGMSVAVRAAADRPRTLILVSRPGHCLNDLLYRRDIGDLPVEIVGIVSNHRDWEGLVAARGLGFHHLPVTPDGRAAAERQLSDLAAATGAELIVLARYMQILSPALCAAFAGRLINIHHSFLPGFKGARPYHQAHAHGVKLIGATAHYVTADLDEGPIIEQEVIRVDHAMPPDQLAAAGRDIENIVLARAIRWHAESRVLLNGNKTVVFR